jgi:tRNA (guanosine-2'-O-)-methyltransferase
LLLSTQEPVNEESVKQMLIDTGLLRENEQWIADMILPQRLMRLYQVLSQRTRYISILLEAIDDGHNQAAVLRTADAFGVQNITVVEGDQPFEPNRKVTQGSHKWLTIHKQPDLQTAIRDLTAQGYQICATYLGNDAVPIGEIDLSRPTVLLFGNEHRGISEEAADLAHQKFYIPMVGFVQSFNISVAAALTLQEVTKRARETAGDRYYLTSEEKREVFLDWVIQTLQPRLRDKVRKSL